jgi:serine/threonine protein kinase
LPVCMHLYHACIIAPQSVQEFCNGGSLRVALEKGYFSRSLSSAAQRWQLITSVLVDMAQGMAHVHSKRICHGDFHPANVLLKVCHIEVINAFESEVLRALRNFKSTRCAFSW